MTISGRLLWLAVALAWLWASVTLIGEGSFWLGAALFLLFLASSVPALIDNTAGPWRAFQWVTAALALLAVLASVV